MKRTALLSLGLAAMVAMPVTACSDNSAPENVTTREAAETVAGTDLAPNSHAAQFLTKAMKGNNSEVMLGHLAAGQGASEDVREFGAMLATDHGAVRRDVAELARTMGVAVIDDTLPEADAEYARLQGLNGAAFDQEFLSYMIEVHQKDIETFREEARSDDPQAVTALASQTVPILEKHLETARDLAETSPE